MKPEGYKTCHECGLLHKTPQMSEGSRLLCSRCGALLMRHPYDSFNRTLALSITGLILFIISNAYPFLSLEIQGQTQETILLTGILELYKQGLVWLAFLVFLTIVFLPLIQLLSLIHILIPLKFKKCPWQLPLFFRIIHCVTEWSMMDVFMLGILVSMVKLADMADVLIGPAFYSYMVLIFIVSAAVRSFDPDIIWTYSRHLPSDETPHANYSAQMAECHCCHLLCNIPETGAGEVVKCPRCHSSLHYRKSNSIARTWALVISAIIFYIPANFYPVSIVDSLAGTQADTLISSVVYFFHHGMIHIALVIFIASVFVPLLKILILILLLVSVRVRSQTHRRERTILYRITEVLGRWSMVDVYVVTVLVAMVKLGGLASIQAGPGIVYFAAVVVITMFAAGTFDPRLIWDSTPDLKSTH